MIKGLIKKDLYNLAAYKTSMIIMVLFCGIAIIGSKAVTYGPVIICTMVGMIALSTFNYDEIAKSNKYVLTLPTNRKEIVKSKYILAIGSAIVGGIIGVRFQNPSNKILSFILSLAGGLMTSILSFDLIPEALKIASITNVILGIALGIFCMIVCNYLVDKKFTENSQMLRSIKEENKKDLLRAGIVTSIGLAIHNFPEGLAIGSGFGASLTLGYSLAIAICIHDIPEGISMAVPMKNGGMKTSKVLYYVILSGVTTGIGALIGKIIGGISQDVIAVCLSFAAGAMLYIVSGELIPESNKIYDGKASTIGTIIGFILGLIAVNI